MTHDHKRHGTTDLFATMNVGIGHVLYDTKTRHSSKEILDFFRFVDLHVAPELDIHVVLDNLSAHKSEQVAKCLAPSARSLAPALHTDEFVVAQFGRELVQPTHQSSLEERDVLIGASTRRRDRHLVRGLERRSETVHLEETRRRDHCEGQAGPSAISLSQFTDRPLEGHRRPISARGTSEACRCGVGGALNDNCGY